MKVKEIFRSIQGEGRHIGRQCVFVRFAGCNLCCPFCDTEHEGGIEMSEEEIVSAVAKAVDTQYSWSPNFVVLTGGEPFLQVTGSLLRKLKAIRIPGHHPASSFDMGLHIETNGTVFPDRLTKCDLVLFDEITVSPKQPIVGREANEILKWASTLKMLYPFPGGITMGDVVDYTGVMEEVRFRIQYDFEAFPNAHSAAVRRPAVHILQPVTPVGGFETSDHFDEYARICHDAYSAMNELTGRTRQRWRLLPQAHRAMRLM